MLKPWIFLVCLPAIGAAQSTLPTTYDAPRLIHVGAAAKPILRTVDARTLPVLAPWQPGMQVKDVEAGQDVSAKLLKRYGPLAPAAQAFTPPVQLSGVGTRAPLAFGTPVVNVDGINYTGALPADPTGDVGPDHYVQAVNAAVSEQIAIYNKADGALAAGPFALNTLGSGLCAQPGLGDPQVLYDGLAQRWILASLGPSGSNALCVYLSSGSNPVISTWAQYIFTFPGFPDYPKLALWDNAYGLSMNMSTPAPNISYTFATLDRSRMLAGQAASALTFQSTRLANNFNAFTPIAPVGLKGINPPKPGAPLTFVANIDDELFFFGEPGNIDLAFDKLYLYTVVPNFDTPAASVLTGPIVLSVGDFQFFSAQFPLQPNGVGLPSFTGTPMHRVSYRNQGDYEAIVLAVADVIDNGTLYTDPNLGRHTAPHWLELRRTGGPAQPWTVANEGVYGSTFGPDAETVRFMPAINMDSAGNLALAYTTLRVDPAVHPSLRYTGRLAGDPPSAMPFAETTLVAGTQSQPAQAFRWGDYFDMSLDPDGCRFWFTGAYMDDANWGTRIGAIRHDDCGPPDFSMSAAVTQFQACSVNSSNLPVQTVSLQSLNAFWQDVSLSWQSLPPGISANAAPATVRPSGSTSASLSVAAGTSSGIKTATLVGTSGSLVHTQSFSVDVDAAATAAPSVLSPADGASNQSLVTRLTWAPIAGARHYVVEGSTSSAFTTLAFGQTISGTQYDTPVLAGNTTYFWRVRGRNLCGEGANSPPRSFVTLPSFCTVVNTSISNGGTVNHTINVPQIAGVLNNLDVRFVANNATVSDLRVGLTRLSDNRSVRLLEPGCSAGASVSTYFDDSAAAPACSGSTLPTSVRPVDALSAFDGAPLTGDWRITVTDTVVGNPTGTFILWCLAPQGIGAPQEAVFASGFE